MGGTEIGALSILVGLFVWFLKTTTRQQVIREGKHDKIQAEDRLFNRELITGTLKEIHSTGLESAQLSRESIRTVKTLCDKMNGGTEGQRAIKAIKAINERKKKSKMKVERRA